MSLATFYIMDKDTGLNVGNRKKFFDVLDAIFFPALLEGFRPNRTNFSLALIFDFGDWLIFD